MSYEYESGIIIGADGSGKRSFLHNHFIVSSVLKKECIRVIDIGGSYRNTAKLLAGRYIEIAAETHSLNPFSFITDPDDELVSVAAMFSQMGGSDCAETEKQLIREAVSWAWNRQGQNADAGTVHDFLRQFEDVATNPAIQAAAKNLAVSVAEFTTNGKYGHFFAGPAIDVRRDPFVVFDLANLKDNPSLFRVVVPLVINLVTQSVYLGNNLQSTRVIFDDAWQYLGETFTPGPVIEEAFRRCVLTGTSVLTVLMSLNDLEYLGVAGEVIKETSAYTFLLKSGVIEGPFTPNPPDISEKIATEIANLF